MSGNKWLVAALYLLGAGWCCAQQASDTKAANSEVRSALALEQQGKFAEAEAAWQRVVKADPKNAGAFAQLGLLEAHQEHYSAAIPYYRQALALQPELPNLKLNLGLALFKSEDFAEAAKLFESELQRHPKSQRAQQMTILAGMSEYALHRYSIAAGYLKVAAARDPKNLPLRLTLAHCYLWTKQFDAVLAIYKEILAIDPNSAEADMLAGEAMDGMHDTDGAIAQFRAAEMANPKEPNVHFGLGYLLWTQKNFPEAIEEFNAELQNDPQSSSSMIYLGDTYVRLSQLDLAKQLLERAATLPTSDPLLHLDLGIVYAELENKEDAVKQLSQAVAMEPDNVTAHFRLAKVLQSLGKMDEAKAEFAKASSLNKKTDLGLYQRITEAGSKPAPRTQDADPGTPEK